MVSIYLAVIGALWAVAKQTFPKLLDEGEIAILDQLEEVVWSETGEEDEEQESGTESIPNTDS